ncbi:MAG: sigma-70 family RNA polymerase sigma factor [Planctomycetes bacterium]|nr:sigma-70 family RNA polymerase sigma factor [Planctomycetota bacterium]
MRPFPDPPTSEPLSPHAARLVAQRGFVRALARRLVAPAAADDVAQEVLTASLAAPPREAGALRGWLATATRQLAAKWWRSEARRGTRERGAAQREALPSTAELVERVELEQELSRAVLALGEPERTTLLLRFHEGLTPGEIAARVGLPADTVRARLRRGLERLRAELDRRYGAHGWVALLLPIAGVRTVAELTVGAAGASGSAASAGTVPVHASGGTGWWVGGACAAGVSIMAIKSWLTVGLASAALVAVGYSTRTSWLPPALVGSGARVEAPSVAPLADPASVAHAPLADAALPEAQREAAQRDGDPNAAVSELPQAGRVTFTLVDEESGLPIGSDVQVRFLADARFAEHGDGATIDVGLTAGRWSALVEARGYEPLLLPDFTVEPAVQLALGPFALSRGHGVIEGEVIARHLPDDAPVQVELRGRGRRRCADCRAAVQAAAQAAERATEEELIAESNDAPQHGCGDGDDPTWFTLSRTRRFRFTGLAEGSYFLRAFDPARRDVAQVRVDVARGGYTWQALDVSAPTHLVVELRHARGALFGGDWATFHREERAPIEFLVERDAKRIAEGTFVPEGEAVRASVGPPLVLLPAMANGENEANGTLQERAVVQIMRLLQTRVESTTRHAFLTDFEGSPIYREMTASPWPDRIDRERAAEDALRVAVQEPQLEPIGLDVVAKRSDAFLIGPLPRAQLSLTVRCGGYESAPVALDLRYGEPLPQVVALEMTERRREELAWIALPEPDSCTQCHEQRRGQTITFDFGSISFGDGAVFTVDGGEGASAGVELIYDSSSVAPPEPTGDAGEAVDDGDNGG